MPRCYFSVALGLFDKTEKSMFTIVVRYRLNNKIPKERYRNNEFCYLYFRFGKILKIKMKLKKL